VKRAALAAVLLAAAAASPDPVVAVRGTDQITASQVRALIAGADPQTRARLTQDPAALQALIRNALLQRAVLEAAHAANWERKPDVAAMLARTRDAAIAQSFLASHAAPPAGYPSEAELQAAYDQARPQLMQPRAYHLSQLFITLPATAPGAATPGAAAATGATGATTTTSTTTAATAGAAGAAQAKQTLAALHDGFAAGHPAKLPPGVQAADLGWVPENRLQPDAHAAISGLLEGQVSAPVCTPAGCALLKLVATRPAGPAPLAEVRDGLIRLMRQQKQRQGEQAYANTLLARAPVRVDEIQLSHLSGQ
jgi:peptidylprolyl isomerase